MFLDFLKRQPIVRKLFFREQERAQELFLALSTQTEISGLSFMERQIFITQVPTMEEIRRFHEDLVVRVDDFMDLVKEKIPNIHEIGKSDAKTASNATYAVKVFTYIDSLTPMAYFVYGVYFYQKLPNTNYWKRMEEPATTPTGRVDPRYTVPIYDNYPDSISLSFCGACGDVNYLRQQDFTFFTEKFYSDAPIETSGVSDISTI